MTATQCKGCGTTGSVGPGQSLTESGWLRHQGETIGGTAIDLWLCPRCRTAPIDPAGDFECDVCDADEPCDGCWDAL